MARERIEYLINNLQEGLDVEVKNWLGGIQSNAEKAKLAKEIIALANHGGGYVFIGFDDEGEGHPAIEPEQGQLESFSQDAVTAVVNRYVTPPIQCAVSLHQREGSDTRHPVITIPGRHRTPVWASRSSPDERTLVTGRVYVRRPGGSSETAQNQDDWEKLLERLVTARQSDQLNAIRAIMSPPAEPQNAPTSLDDWANESQQIWADHINPLHDGDARKFEIGFWTLAFQIQPFDCGSLGELNQFLDRETPQFSGWRPFTYLHNVPRTPVPRGEEIQAWLAPTHDIDPAQDEAEFADFWRMSIEGNGFSLRPFQEDGSFYLENRHPRPPRGSAFDWTMPVYRMVEFLKFIEAIGLRFGNQNSEFSIILKYTGMLNRQLRQSNLRYHLTGRGPCTVDEVQSQVTQSIHMIELNLEELVYSLLLPVYQQFAFTELPRQTVNLVTQEALNYR